MSEIPNHNKHYSLKMAFQKEKCMSIIFEVFANHSIAWYFLSIKIFNVLGPT